MDIDPNKTTCTSAINGESAYEVSGNKQNVATCQCKTTTSPSPTTTTSQPVIVTTNSSLTSPVSGIKVGETLYGYIA